MTTTCPNCQHPVRTGAKYCGFCGASLMAAVDVEAATLPAIQEPSREVKSTRQKSVKRASSGNTNRVVTSIAIILLFLVILLSIAIRHWAYVSTWLGQILPGLNIP